MHHRLVTERVQSIGRSRLVTCLELASLDSHHYQQRHRRIDSGSECLVDSLQDEELFGLPFESA